MNRRRSGRRALTKRSNVKCLTKLSYPRESATLVHVHDSRCILADELMDTMKNVNQGYINVPAISFKKQQEAKKVQQT